MGGVSDMKVGLTIAFNTSSRFNLVPFGSPDIISTATLPQTNNATANEQCNHEQTHNRERTTLPRTIIDKKVWEQQLGIGVTTQRRRPHARRKGAFCVPIHFRALTD